MHQEAHRMQLRSRQGDKCNKVTSQLVVNRRSVLVSGIWSVVSVKFVYINVYGMAYCMRDHFLRYIVKGRY